MADQNPKNQRVLMDPNFQSATDKENFVRLAEGISANNPDIDSNWIYGVGKVFFDLGKGVDIFGENASKSLQI